MADTTDLKSVARKSVPVRVRVGAPILIQITPKDERNIREYSTVLQNTTQHRAVRFLLELD